MCACHMEVELRISLLSPYYMPWSSAVSEWGTLGLSVH